jgi:hypothetical protein
LVANPAHSAAILAATVPTTDVFLIANATAGVLAIILPKARLAPDF